MVGVMDNDETALLTHHYQIIDVIEKGPLSSIYKAIHRVSPKVDRQIMLLKVRMLIKKLKFVQI